MASLSSVSLDDLCEDLLVEIFACAASSSIPDLHSLRCVSRKFHRLSYKPCIYRRASLDTSMLPWNGNGWNGYERQNENFPIFQEEDANFAQFQQQYSNFVGRCIDCGNPQALFDLGLHQFFECEWGDKQQQEQGLRNLAYAAENGHKAAAEWYGVILISVGGEQKKKGFEILSPFRIPLIPSEVLQFEDRWRTRGQHLWWRLRPIEMVLHLKDRYIRENCLCDCDGLTSRWFAKPWQGWGRFEEFNGMITSMACEVCLWHVVIKILFRV